MNIKESIETLKDYGYYRDEKIYLQCPVANDFFREVLSEFKMDMLPEYEEIISWMENNNGYGLALIGSNGRGKTMVAKKILPLFFYQFFHKILASYDATAMNDKIDEMLTKRIICIDDIGQEDQKVDYGERRSSFQEIMDNAEKKGNLVIFTSNLSPSWIEKKYGLRTRERVRACCHLVIFNGESLRK